MRFNNKKITYSALYLVAILLSACGGGGSSSPPAPTSHTVNISWAANREAAVNSSGGGYTVAISGQTPFTVPYISGTSAAPTMAVATLLPGSYSVAVTAYSALNPPGGTTGSASLPSAAFSFSVP